MKNGNDGKNGMLRNIMGAGPADHQTARLTAFRGIAASSNRGQAWRGIEHLEPRRLLAAVSWTGGAGDNLWQSPGNWSNNAVPTAADDVSIDVPGNPTIQFNQATGNRTVGSLDTAENIEVTGSTLTVAGSAASRAVLRISGGTVNFNGKTSIESLSISSNFYFQGTLGGSGSVTINGASTWAGGTMRGTGTTTIAPGGTLTMTNGYPALTLRRSIINNGTLAWTSGQLEMYGVSIINNGVFDLNPDLGVTCVGLQGTNLLVNSVTGTIQKRGLGQTYFSANSGDGATLRFDSAGVVDVQGGYLQINAPGTSSVGSYHIAADSELYLTGRVTMAQAVDITGAGTLSLAGPQSVEASIALGRLNLQGTDTVLTLNQPTIAIGEIEITSNATLILNTPSSTSASFFIENNGTLRGSGTITFTGDCTWNLGTMSGTGTTIIAPGATLNMTEADRAKTLGRTLRIDGSATWGAAPFSVTTNGRIENNGTFNIDAASGTRQLVGSPSRSFVNSAAGTVNIEGAGICRLNTAFNNAGTVNIDGPRLQLYGGGAATGGTFNLTDGAAVAFAQAYTLDSASSINGGIVQVDTGSTTIDGTIANTQRITMFAGTLTYNGPAATVGGFSISGGTLAGSGNLSITGESTWTAGVMSGTGSVLLASGAALTISGGITRTLARPFQNDGTITWTGGGILLTGGSILNNGTFNMNFATGTTVSLTGGGTNSFQNSPTGSVVKLGAGTGRISTVTGSMSNAGTIDVREGTFQINAATENFAAGTLTGGTWRIANAARLSSTFGDITTNSATIILDGSAIWAAANAIAVNNGTFALTNGRSFGTLGGFTNNGTLELSAGSTFGVTGSFVQTDSGTLRTVLGRADPLTVAGRVTASDTATLAGTLSVTFAANFAPQMGNLFSVVTARTLTGAFATVVAPQIADDRKIVAVPSGNTLRILYTHAADFNNDGMLNADDLSGFVTAYFNSPADPAADFNGDGVVNADDLASYISAFFG